jgi:hypothetical protein
VTISCRGFIQLEYILSDKRLICDGDPHNRLGLLPPPSDHLQMQVMGQEQKLLYSLDANRLIYTIHLHLDCCAGPIYHDFGRVRILTSESIGGLLPDLAVGECEERVTRPAVKFPINLAFEDVKTICGVRFKKPIKHHFHQPYHVFSPWLMGGRQIAYASIECKMQHDVWLSGLREKQVYSSSWHSARRAPFVFLNRRLNRTAGKQRSRKGERFAMRARSAPPLSVYIDAEFRRRS